MFYSTSKLVILAALIVLNSSAVNSQTIYFGKETHVCDSNNPQEKALLDAVHQKDSALVGRLLRQGVNPNAKNDCDTAAIHIAAQSDSPDILKELIAYKADVNTFDGSYRKTPLMLAIDWSLEGETDETYEVVKLLLEAGADVNLRKGSDDPPLTLAVIKELEKVVELFIVAGANINAENDEVHTADGAGRTAYSYAAEMDNRKLKKLLLAAGADPCIGVAGYKREFGSSALVHAATAGRTDVVEALLAEGIDPSTTNPGKVTALMRVVNESSLDALLAAGADVNSKDNAGFTALMWAAYFGRDEHVKKLIAFGADVSATTDDGATALDMAKPEVKEILLQARAKRGRNLLERLSLKRK